MSKNKKNQVENEIKCSDDGNGFTVILNNKDAVIKHIMKRKQCAFMGNKMEEYLFIKGAIDRHTFTRPKKCYKTLYGKKFFLYYECPNEKCENPLGNGEDKYDYCENCGQALDWGE